MSDVANEEVVFEEEGGGPIQVLIEGIDEIPEREPTDPAMKFTKEELAKELALTRKNLEEEKSRTLEMNAIRSLAEELKNRPSGTPPAPLAPRVSEAELKEKFNTGFYDDPYGKLLEFQEQKLAPAVQRIMGANLSTSRKFLMIDPDRKETAVRYGAEIESEIERLAPQIKLEDPDIYQKVHDVVISRHVKDIVDMRVKEAMAAAKTPQKSKPAPFSERGTAPPVGSNPRTIVLTKAEVEYARTKGVSKEEYASYLMRHPDKRVK